MSNSGEPCAEDEPTDHVADIPDAVGCTEIWEHLSNRRTATNGDHS